MRGSWLGRVLGRGESDEGAAELAAREQRLADAAAEDRWGDVLQEARRALRTDEPEPNLLLWAARARLELADSASPAERAEAAAEAGAWLDHALRVAAQTPLAADLWFQRGRAEYIRGNLDEAVSHWRRAFELDHSDRAVRAALIAAWVDQGALPEWGVPVVEHTLLDEPD